MNIIEIGLLISVGISLVLLLLFRLENKKGTRFGEKSRSTLDNTVSDTARSSKSAVRGFFRRILKQFPYFLFHSFLAIILKSIEYIEQGVKKMMHANGPRLQTPDNSQRSKNKLGEIAQHKQDVSLSDKEKKEHKDRALDGEIV